MAIGTRREFLARTAMLGFGVHPLGMAAEGGAKSYGEELPDMLLLHLSKRLNALSTHWDQERDRIQTPREIEARNRFVRDRFAEMIHGFPPKDALNPTVVASFEREGYRVENVMFQSRPDFWVTGNLYIPTSGPGPFPGIISPCGHYPLARMHPDYQFAYINLVKNGFVVLAYDPIGQGERRQYWDPKTDQTEVGNPIYEHSMPGQLLLLLGEDLTHYRVWDGIRAIDYLLTRSEVDKQKIGCAGHSGGGTLTLFISAIDERVQCAVVNQGGTSHRWPLEIRPESQIGPADVEQNYFPGAIHGVDLCDLHVAIAPRPLLALIEDYSPRFNQAAEHIRNRYRQFGAIEKFATEEATDPHAWTVKLRLATTDWLSRWFYGRQGPPREAEFEAEPPERLYCTPLGSVRYSQTGETIFSLIRKRQAQLPPARAVPKTLADIQAYRNQIQSDIAKVLRYERLKQPLTVRHLVTTARKGYKIEKLEFLSEPDIYIPAWIFVPENSNGILPTTLYVNEAGKQADGMEFGLLEKLARKGHLVAAIDVRGVGDTLPPHSPRIRQHNEYQHLFNAETAMSYMAWYMDESLFGMRVRDIVAAIDYVHSRPDAGKRGIRLAGKGMGGLWALYAAALDSRVEQVVCEGSLLSYRSLTEADRYLHGANSFIRDVLLHFDLPHVAAAIADRRLVLLSPVDHMKKPVNVSLAENVYEWTRDVYANAGAADRFQVLDHEHDLYPTLLQAARA
ncbi:MAG: acetylxylan esterase [Bryobacteraceae bacterium]